MSPDSGRPPHKPSDLAVQWLEAWRKQHPTGRGSLKPEHQVKYEKAVDRFRKQALEAGRTPKQVSLIMQHAIRVSCPTYIGSPAKLPELSTGDKTLRTWEQIERAMGSTNTPRTRQEERAEADLDSLFEDE